MKTSMAIPEDEAERLPIINAEKRLSNPPVGTAVYTRRWYLTFVFCVGSFSQACIWNTWGPITNSVEAVLQWKDSDVGMMANYGNIAFLITVMPICWFMDEKGMRKAMLGASTMTLIGCGTRCISLHVPLATWMAGICAALNGIGGAVPFAGPALMSSLWFPLEQRATATALISFANYFGVAMSFIIGPAFVTSPVYQMRNVTHGNSNISSFSVDTYLYEESGNYTNQDISNVDDVRADIFHLLYFHTGLAGLWFLLTLIYFPSKPPLPPSISASKERTEYIKGLSELICNRSMWLVIIASALPAGVLGVWQSILDVILKPLNITQSSAGYLGFWQTLAGCVSGLAIARFSDIFMKRMKTFLILLFIGATCAIAWFTLICEKYISYNTASLYCSCILIGVFINGCVPLFYEISCEASYPVAEGVTGGFLTLNNNLFGIIFLSIMQINGIGHSWQNWALLGASALALPLLFMFPERYRRLDLDITVEVKIPKDNDGYNEDTNERYA